MSSLKTILFLIFSLIIIGITSFNVNAQIDLQMSTIVYPPITGLYTGTLGYSVACKIKNNGTIPVGGNPGDYTVEAWIGLTSGFPENADHFLYVATPPALSPGTTSGTLNLLPTWVPAVPGNYTVRFQVTIPGDVNTSNDTMSISRTVNSFNYGGGGSGSGGYYYANTTTDALNNTPSYPIYDWINPISAGHALLTSWASGNADDGYSAPLSLPFSFSYFGNSYSDLYIGSNGIITFGAGSSDKRYYSEFLKSAPYNLIAGAWADLDNTTATYSDAHIYYGGDINDFVVTFWHAHYYGLASDYITFQIILKANGNIKIQYNNAETTNPPPSSIVNNCAVGIENSTSTLGIQYRNCNNTPPGGPMFGSPLAVEFGLNSSALPVELTSFTAKLLGNTVGLTWTTKTETNNRGFEIERTSYSKALLNEWQKIGYEEGFGTTTESKIYSFIDRKVTPGINKYRLKQIDLSGTFKYSNEIKINFNIPGKFELSQNYPNPFNPSTIIKYSIPRYGFVNISVYNIVGEKIANLVNQNMAAGSYEVLFDASRYSSGIYFYSMESENYSSFKKMILIK